jgi:hypothetical protein
MQSRIKAIQEHKNNKSNNIEVGGWKMTIGDIAFAHNMSVEDFLQR